MKSNQHTVLEEKISWRKSLPFILLHFTPLLIFFIDVTIADFVLCFVLYYVRMFFITAGYHRYFSHRSYKLGRFAQFIMALGGTLAVQKGPLWWASHHRMHHKFSDTELDVHSPKKGFWWSHIGWILSSKYEEPLYDKIADFAKYPEIRFLDRFHVLPPIILGGLIWCFLGAGALLVGGVLSTILLYHGTFFINSLAHVFGSRRFVTEDTSRNSLLLAIITCGEGWHNNHHHYQASAKQGFRWWELDMSYYVLRILWLLGVAKSIKVPPKKVLQRQLIADGCFDVGMANAKVEKIVTSKKNASN